MNELLPGFEPLAMQCRNDCGPVAMLQLIRYSSPPGSRPVERDDLLRVWRYREGADRLDTPGHHLRTLHRLGMRYAFRRRLGRELVARALDDGFPVALLLPTGAVRWHWIVGCGRAPRAVVVSAGDGEPRPVPWDALDRARLRHTASRALGIEGLGYVIGPRRPDSVVDPTGPRRPDSVVDPTGHEGLLAFPTDHSLEKDILRLAAVAEETLAPGEAILDAARVLAGKGDTRGLTGAPGGPGGRP